MRLQHIPYHFYASVLSDLDGNCDDKLMRIWWSEVTPCDQALYPH